jgi:hypothetical protein
MLMGARFLVGLFHDIAVVVDDYTTRIVEHVAVVSEVASELLDVR